MYTNNKWIKLLVYYLGYNLHKYIIKIELHIPKNYNNIPEPNNLINENMVHNYKYKYLIFIAICYNILQVTEKFSNSWI